MIKISSIEREMKLQRKNITAQNERMNSYKQELATVKSTLQNKEKENESLIKKLADVTMKNKMLEQKQEPHKKRIESLEMLTKTLQSQIEDLKKARTSTKKETGENQMTESKKPENLLPPGLYELLKDLADKPGLGINYTLKLKNYLNEVDAPVSKKSKVISQ